MAWYETALVSACATIAAAAAAAFFAISQIHNQRRIARTRATLDIIVKYESDAFYQLTVEAFRAFHAGAHTPAEMIDPQTEDARRQASLLNAFLNFQEIVALGIRHDALDRALFGDWWAGSYLKVWNAALPLIRLQRERAPKALAEFEHLARSFAKERKLTFEEPNAPAAKAAP